MRSFRYILSLALCVILLFTAVSCGKGELEVPHTHQLAQRYIKAQNCYSYGYHESYCEFCNYSVKESDNILGEHVYNTYYTIDVEPTYSSPGKKSRHCMWYEHCGMSIDTQDTDSVKPGEDFPPQKM